MASGELSSLAALNGSHESFHSTQSNQNALTSDLRVAANEDGQLQLQDVEAFLNNPESQALLATSTLSKKQNLPAGKQRASDGTSSSSTEPIELGAPKTSHYVTLLYLQSQQRG